MLGEGGGGVGVDCVNRAASDMWPSPLQCLAQIRRRERKATSRKNRSRFTDGLVGPRRRPQRQPAWAGGRGMPPHGSLGATVFPGPHTDLHIFSRHLCFKAEKKRERERERKLEYREANATETNSDGAPAMGECVCGRPRAARQPSPRARSRRARARAPCGVAATWSRKQPSCLHSRPSDVLLIPHLPSLHGANLNSFHCAVNPVCCLCGDFHAARAEEELFDCKGRAVGRFVIPPRHTWEGDFCAGRRAPAPRPQGLTSVPQNPGVDGKGGQNWGDGCA